MAFIGLKVKLVLYAVFGASMLVALGWFFEILSAERSKILISKQIGSAEEGSYDLNWEDANIRVGYFTTHRMLNRLKRNFTIIEPTLWIYLIGVIIFFQGKQLF